MQKDERVALRSNQTWTGTIEHVREDGTVKVAGDNGWSGVLDAADLVSVPEGKSAAWPPPLETK